MSNTSRPDGSPHASDASEGNTPTPRDLTESYVLLVKQNARTRRFVVCADSESSDLARIKLAAGDDPVTCELCLREQMEGRICLFRAGNDQGVGARRWPGSEHVCVRFRGEPVTAFRELEGRNIDIAKLCGTTKGANNFRLVMTDPLLTKRTKAVREKGISGYAARAASRNGTAVPLPSRSLGGALVVMMEEAGFNVANTHSRKFPNGFGMMETLEGAFLRSPGLRKSMRHPVLFPEVLLGGSKLGEKIGASLSAWSGTRKHPTRVFLIGRLKCRRRDSDDPTSIVFQLTGMDSDWIHMDKVLWDYWGAPEGKVPWFATNSETELVAICRVQSIDGKLRASNIAFVPVDCYGMPFPESKFEPRCARILRAMRVPFAKPCHSLLRIGDRRVWPDFVLTDRNRNTVVIEVDPGGFSKKPEKFTKQIHYGKYGIVVISWDPDRHSHPLLDWNDFSRADELF